MQSPKIGQENSYRGEGSKIRKEQVHSCRDREWLVRAGHSQSPSPPSSFASWPRYPEHYVVLVEIGSWRDRSLKILPKL